MLIAYLVLGAEREAFIEAFLLKGIKMLVAQKPSTLNCVRVLFVDNNEAYFSKITQKMSSNHADFFDLKFEKNYQIAIDACSSGLHDVAIIGEKLWLDTKSDVEGLAFVREARDRSCSIPLVLISSDEHVRPSLFKQGASAVLTPKELSDNGIDLFIWSIVQSTIIEDRFRVDREKLELTLNSIKNGVIVVRDTGAIDYMNLNAEKLLGVDLMEVVGAPLLNHFSVIDEMSQLDIGDDIIEKLHSQQPFKYETGIILQSTGGDQYIVECYFHPIFLGSATADKDSFNYAIIINDVSDARKYNQKLVYESTHDQLTGLSNRTEFEKILQEAIEQSHEHEFVHTVLYMDIDQFKVINDTCGHIAGDELLQQVAEKLKSTVRQRDTLARIGGDEYGLLLWRCNVEDGKRIANDIMEKLSELRFNWNDKSFSVSMSIGLVFIDQSSMTWADVLSLADFACFEAKEHGRNQIYVAGVDDVRTAKRFGEMEWVAEIVQALEDKGFDFYSQEIRSTDTEKTGYRSEILLRYVDRNGQIYMPDSFLPPAERYNVITMIDRWVLQRLATWLSDNPEYVDSTAMISVNLSGLTIQDERSMEYFVSVFENVKFDPSKICFEISESTAVNLVKQSNNFINQLSAYGCKFALDDFGVGISSFAYLKHLPVNYLKIDGSFIKNILKDPVDFALVKTVVEIAHIMGKETIAEFCEEEAVYNKLKEMGVDYVQGYYIGEPEYLFSG